jgi:hypothetical protein
MSVPAVSGDLSEVYAVSVQKKTLDQQKVEGEQAVKLVESARPEEPAPLPPDATFSTRA